VGLCAQLRQPVAHRDQASRAGSEASERVLELVARAGLVEILRYRCHRTTVELELPAWVAAGREQQLGPANRRLDLIRVELNILSCEPGEAGQQIVARPRLEELQQLTHAGTLDHGMYAKSSGGAPTIGVSKSGPAPSGSTTTAPLEAKNCAIWSWAASATAPGAAGASPGTLVRNVCGFFGNVGLAANARSFRNNVVRSCRLPA